MIIYRPLKAIQKRLGVRHIYVDEKTEKVIIIGSSFNKKELIWFQKMEAILARA